MQTTEILTSKKKEIETVINVAHAHNLCVVTGVIL